MPLKKKNQKDIQDYMRPDIDPDDVDNNEDLDSVVDPEWGPETHEVHDLEDDDDDDASPKMATSRIYKVREEARGRKTKRKQDRGHYSWSTETY